MNYIMQQYDDCLREILENGFKKEDRTGVGTLSLFGLQQKYDISEHFPLITGRKVSPKAGFAELLWFISGSTLNSDLQNLGANYWTPWVDTSFEVKHGYVKGAFGPLYGFQLRYFGGDYGNGDPHYWRCSSGFNEPELTYGAGGFDQLSWLMEEIKTNPNSRRLLFSLWNPKQMDAMRLPPCAYAFQLNIQGDKIHGLLSQRSCDVPLGVVQNIFFYSAFLYMIAQQTGYKPGTLTHSLGDAHIYLNQIEMVKEYLSREKPASPKLILNKAKDIFSYTVGDFQIEDYNPLPKLDIPVAV